MFGLDNIVNLAVVIVLSKFPEAVKEYERNKLLLFETSGVVSDELVEKHLD